MLDVSAISASYQQKKVLHSLSFQVSKSEIVALIGASGVGKSTLLNCLAGLHPLDNGQILLNQEPLSPKEQTIGWIPQQYGLLPWKTVYQNIQLHLTIKKIPKNQQKERILAMMNHLGILELRHKFPTQLSGGQCQRVAIARAFVLKTDLLLMDEPFSALDAFTREQTQQLFLKQWLQTPTPTLFVTHDIDEAVYLSSKILLLTSSPEQSIHTFENPCFAIPEEKRRTAPLFQETIQQIRRELLM